MLELLGDLLGFFFDACFCGLWDSSSDDDGDWKPQV